MPPTRTTTTAPISPDAAAGAPPEFGRADDVRRMFGLKRGSLYALTNAGKVRAVLLRCQGKKSGIRLWDLASIRDFIFKQMQAQTAALLQEGQQHE